MSRFLVIIQRLRTPSKHPSIMAYSRHPEPPLGFVRRSDPNFYFLARKF